MFSKTNQKGYGIVEIIITLSLGMILLFGVDQFLNISLKTAMDDMKKTEALSLAESLLEQARAVRDEEQVANREYGWDILDGLTKGNVYHFDASGANPEKWIYASGNNTVGRYTVWIVISEVRRDATSDDIVPSGGVVDTNTIRVDAYASWTTSGGAQQVNLYEYLTNYR